MEQNLSERLKYIPDGTQTLSKAHFKYPASYPKYFVKGDGCYVWDEHGNKYIDFVCSLGPIILGHNYPSITEAVTKRIRQGTIFSLPHSSEEELAKKLCDRFVGAEMARFAKNGVDVTSAAIRLARYVAEKEKILCGEYHGCADWFLGSNKDHPGVPDSIKEEVVQLRKYDNKQAEIQFAKGNVAAVIIEPYIYEKKSDRPGAYGNWRRHLAYLCRKYNALLIYDEIVSGFRHPYEWPEETPDLRCIGKALGNGFPIAALIGKKRYMEQLHTVFFSTTFGGDLVGISAAIAVLDEIDNINAIILNQKIGQYFLDQATKISEEYRVFEIYGKSPRLFFDFKIDKDRAVFMQECCKKGVFFGIPIFFNASMEKKDIDQAILVMDDVSKNFNSYKLEGEIPLFWTFKK